MQAIRKAARKSERKRAPNERFVACLVVKVEGEAENEETMSGSRSRLPARRGETGHFGVTF